MVGDIYEEGAAKKLDKIAGAKNFQATWKIPWTQIAPMENVALKGEDLKLYQSIAGLRNAYLKMRSGGAVTDPEAERFLQELGQGDARTGAQLQTGIQNLTRAVKLGVQNKEAGYSPEAVALYRSRNGPISSESLPTPKQKKDAAAPATAPTATPATAPAPKAAAFDPVKFRELQLSKGRSEQEISEFLKTKGY